jgi:hypothetical protein
VNHELYDLMLRIETASDIVLDVAQPLHDRESTHYIITRLSFCCEIIDEACAKVRQLGDEAQSIGREAGLA